MKFYDTLLFFRLFNGMQSKAAESDMLFALKNEVLQGKKKEA